MKKLLLLKQDQQNLNNNMIGVTLVFTKVAGVIKYEAEPLFQEKKQRWTEGIHPFDLSIPLIQSI
jgi:hypothetical protein